MKVDQNARHIGAQISCRRDWGSLPFKRKLYFRYRRYFINGTLVLVVNSHLYIRSNRDKTCLDVILCNERITKALISLRRCAGWSAPLLFANPQRLVFLCGDPYVPFVDNGKCSKTLFSLFSNKMLLVRAGIHKMFVRVMFPMVKVCFIPKFKENIPNSRKKISPFCNILTTLHCATTSCNFAFQILKWGTKYLFFVII